MEMGVRAGALVEIELRVTAGALVGLVVDFEKSPVKIRERTTIVNDEMCLSIRTS
jgi:hypothetical protein